MPELTVGVIVPAFNAAPFLDAALDSIRAQAHPVTDIVVVDDGSQDDTVAVAERAGAPVRVVRQEHAGIGASRNRGLAAVRGEVIAMLDADDLFAAAAITMRVAALARAPELDIVFGHVRSFTELDSRGGPVPLDALRPSHTVGSILARRATFDRVGPFTEGLRVAEGLDWLLRAREVGLTETTIAEQVVWRRIHGNNNSTRERDSRQEFARAIKASLDRRRAAQTGADPAAPDRPR
jgi:glycosyltransferase involved in cell wall biosynthesis